MGGKSSTFKTNVAREQAAAYLEELATSLRAGTVALTQGDRQVVLHPAASMALELEVSDKKGRQRLELELTWYAAPELPSEDTQLTISADAPPVPAANLSDDEEEDEDQDEDDEEDSGDVL